MSAGGVSWHVKVCYLFPSVKKFLGGGGGSDVQGPLLNARWRERGTSGRVAGQGTGVAMRCRRTAVLSYPFVTFPPESVADKKSKKQ